MAIAQKYREPTELSPQMVNEFVDKIVVHAPEKIDGQRTMRIDIIFRFIGNFTVPQIEAIPTEEQLRQEEHRAKERERNHANYLRRKEKKLAPQASA